MWTISFSKELTMDKEYTAYTIHMKNWSYTTHQYQKKNVTLQAMSKNERKVPRLAHVFLHQCCKVPPFIGIPSSTSYTKKIKLFKEWTIK